MRNGVKFPGRFGARVRDAEAERGGGVSQLSLHGIGVALHDSAPLCGLIMLLRSTFVWL